MDQNIFQINQAFIDSLIKEVATSVAEQINAAPSSRWVGEECAMEILGVQKSTLAKLRSNNEILFAKSAAKNIRYCLESLDSYLLRKSNQPYYQS